MLFTNFRTGRHARGAEQVDPPCPGAPARTQSAPPPTLAPSFSTATTLTAHQHTRVRTENRAACPRASPESTDHVHERRVPPPLHRPARLVRGVRGLHIPAPMLLLNSQLHAPFSTRVGATYTHQRTRRHGAPQSRNNLDGTGSGYSKGHSPVTALARHSARPSQRSPVTALARHRARPSQRSTGLGSASKLQFRMSL